MMLTCLTSTVRTSSTKMTRFHPLPFTHTLLRTRPMLALLLLGQPLATRPVAHSATTLLPTASESSLRPVVALTASVVADSDTRTTALPALPTVPDDVTVVPFQLSTQPTTGFIF